MTDNNRRRYIRLSTVLPVEFFIADKNGKKITPWIQGFTHDIGRGGICLVVNDLWWGFWDKFNRTQNKIFLRIKLPFKKEPLFLEAAIRWKESEELKKFKQYRVGLEFISSKKKKAAPIFRFAIFKKVAPVVVVSILTGFILFSSFLFWKTNRLAQENRRLVSDHIEILQKNSFLAQNLKDNKQAQEFLAKRKNQLGEKITNLEETISNLKKEYKELKDIQKKNQQQSLELIALEEKLNEYNQRLDSLKRENEFLKSKIKEKKRLTAEIQEEAQELKGIKHRVTEKVIAGMHDWIRHRQDLVKGLILSYEGDSSLREVCFTYDQALAAFVFLNYGEIDRAQKVLDFYLNQINQGKKIYNAYFTDGGVFEYVLHSGPQAWIGLAALNYREKTKSKRYIKVANEVADFLIRMQDKEGGIVGGPKVSWYSTEHNLDAYAFFRLLYKQTGKREYEKVANKVKKWISKYSYTQYKIPINRGKGDSTIATDTYTWSITALGPQTLYSMGMDPEEILKFAENNCKVTVNFEYDNRKVKVEGFDFAKAKHAARGGVISGEWTSQMILAYEVMADYFKQKDTKKYKEYLAKAYFYSNQLQKMIITSPSRAGRIEPCLPYASSPYVNTGHGWRTPRGSRTGSLASTAYFLIAYNGYNPLRGEFLDVSLKIKDEK
ncbi:MAG: PilZ domain-containing protein [Candidatus Omnitrophica bacterium]|nr:PilZ domain-containing protein [Candidatus Omnitrophota bacterium]MCF7894012.1 PilZ domain-containing protein [Candidatus Omnitrophota bacterium]